MLQMTVKEVFDTLLRICNDERRFLHITSDSLKPSVSTCNSDIYNLSLILSSVYYCIHTDVLLFVSDGYSKKVLYSCYDYLKSECYNFEKEIISLHSPHIPFVELSFLCYKHFLIIFYNLIYSHYVEILNC